MKHFHTDKDPRDSTEIIRITWIGLIVNLFLSIFKFIVGFLGYSHAVIADAFHSLSDMSTDLAVLLGVKYWSAPADENHPYGHSRIETIITAIIGLVLLLVALGIIFTSINHIREVHLKQPAWIAITGSLLSIILKEVLYRLTVVVGRKTRSSAVVANAWHHRSDALSSLPALIAVSLAVINPKLAYIDHIGALIVSIFILKISWDITLPCLSELSDTGAPRRYYEKIKSIALDIKGVEAVHAIRTRKSGSGLYIDLHIMVDGKMTVQKGHEISGIVKYALLEKIPEILDVVIHLEPYE
ncbi:MAG: cation diffusion facilitator family transporter [bacterium]